MAEVASAYVSLIPSFRGGRRHIARELGSAGDAGGKDASRRFGSSFASGLKRVGGAMVAGALAGVAIGVAKVGRAGWESAKGIQQTTATLTGLYGSAETANTTLAMLRKTASRSPVEFQAFAK